MNESIDRKSYWPPTVRQVFWGTIVLIIVLSIFVFVFPLNGVTLWKWLDIMVLPAAVVFLAFVLNEAVTQRESARDRQNAENEYRKNFLMSVMRAYNGAKKVRRVLKAHRSNDMIPCTVYEAQMETLMDSQLELELYKREEVTMQPNVLLLAFEDKKRTEISDRRYSGASPPISCPKSRHTCAVGPYPPAPALSPLSSQARPYTLFWRAA